MKNDRIHPLNWRSLGSLEIATDMLRTFKIDRTEGSIRLSLSDQLEEYLIGTCNSVAEAKRMASEKRLELLRHDSMREVNLPGQ